jgi:hypothetical protein
LRRTFTRSLVIETICASLQIKPSGVNSTAQTRTGKLSGKIEAPVLALRDLPEGPIGKAVAPDAPVRRAQHRDALQPARRRSREPENVVAQISDGEGAIAGGGEQLAHPLLDPTGTAAHS